MSDQCCVQKEKGRGRGGERGGGLAGKGGIVVVETDGRSSGSS